MRENIFVGAPKKADVRINLMINYTDDQFEEDDLVADLWGEQNESEWQAIVKFVRSRVESHGLASDIFSLGADRFSPFVVDVGLLRPENLQRITMLRIARSLRRDLRSLTSNWTIEFTLIPMTRNNLQDALWLSIDRYRVVEYLAQVKTELFEDASSFEIAYLENQVKSE
jgi:hypothetical protein